MGSKKPFFSTDNPLLRRTGSDRAAPEGTPARPQRGGDVEATHQSTVFLGTRQIEWLEDQHRQISRSGGSKKIKKAALIRALVSVAMEAPIDLQGVTSEREMAERIKTGLCASAPE
jgi:hypothetical protein